MWKRAFRNAAALVVVLMVMSMWTGFWFNTGFEAGQRYVLSQMTPWK